MSMTDISLTKHLSKEIKSDTQLEVVVEMIAAWLDEQAQKYLYFDDQDPCSCGDSESAEARPREAMTDLAQVIRTGRVVLWHNSGECTSNDDDDDEDDEDDD